MDAAEKALLIKVLENFATSEMKEEAKRDESDAYLREPEEYLTKLNKRAISIKEKNDFNVGDILIWKDGLKNKVFPAYGQPAIILERFIPALIDPDVSYNEKLDVQIGFISSNDEFLTFNYDSSRFKLYKI